MKRTTIVIWSDVETAFERNAAGLCSFIKRATGEVIFFIKGDPEDAPLAQAVSACPDDYIAIEPASSQEQYRWMEQFVVALENDPLRNRLSVVIDGKGAFRRFKDLLLGFPEEREQWFKYRGDQLHHHINEWFEANEIEPDPLPPWGEVSVPPPTPETPPLRSYEKGLGPADLLREQIKAIVDMLSGGELHSAKVFLEYLRERGMAELVGRPPKSDLKRPFRRPTDDVPIVKDADPASVTDAQVDLTPDTGSPNPEGGGDKA